MSESIIYQDIPAQVANSNYKWLSGTLLNAQNGPSYQPNIKLRILDDTTNPNAILNSPNVPVLGEAVTAPDGNILMAGGDGSGNLKFWKVANAGTTIPAGTLLVASGNGYVSTLNTSIAVSNWINGSYVIDVAFWAVSGGNNIIQVARSADGGNTWTINPYTISVPTFSPQNFYVAAAQPVYNPALGLTMSTIFYIRGNTGVSSSYYKICYVQWIGGASYGSETTWSRVADSQDWTLHSLDIQYLNGSYYIFFSGYHNWYDTPSVNPNTGGLNNNYGIYMAELDNITSNSTTDSWQITRTIFVSSSSQGTNNNSFTYPRISTDGNLFHLVCNAVVGEGLQTGGVLNGSTQIGTLSENYYYMFQSLDLVNFTYPLPIFFTNGTVYADTAGVSFVNQGLYYYLLGNGQNWQYLKNNIIADVTNSVLNYQIQEVSGSASTITIVIGNANNTWLGTNPSGIGAAAITVNKKILLEQGYVTSAGNEITPRNIFYIDTIVLSTTSNNNTATITGRDVSRNLQNVSTKFSYFSQGPSYYNDLFDGTTLPNWNQINGNWAENNGVLYATGSTPMVELNIVQGNLNNNQESSIIFTTFSSPFDDGGYVAFYPYYQDSSNFFQVKVAYNASLTIHILTINIVINSSTVHSASYDLPLLNIRAPIFIRKYNYHTFDILVGTGNTNPITYTDDCLDPNGSCAPFVAVAGISLDSYFSFSLGTLSALVQGGIGLGVGSTYTNGNFQPFKYLQFGPSLSLQETMEYLGNIAGVNDYKRETSFFDNIYSHADYNGSYAVTNGMMVIQPIFVVGNTSSIISNGEINFTASVSPVSDEDFFGFNFFFRASSSSATSGQLYYFQVATSSEGTFVRLLIGVNGTSYQLASSLISANVNSLPIDITKLHTYRVVMIDQLFYFFIDGETYLMWHDTNYTINSITFSNGFWGMEALSNSILTIGDFVSYMLYNQVGNITFNPGDDMTSIMQNALEIMYAFSYTDQLGRFIGITLGQLDPADYTYENIMYELSGELASQNTVNEVIVAGSNVIATYKDMALISALGQVRSLSITDYTITTYQDALTRAINELINANRLNTQNNPNNPMNVGSELFDVIIIINTGTNSANVNGTFRIYNQTFNNNGSNGQYSIQIETGTL